MMSWLGFIRNVRGRLSLRKVLRWARVIFSYGFLSCWTCCFELSNLGLGLEPLLFCVCMFSLMKAVSIIAYGAVSR